MRTCIEGFVLRLLAPLCLALIAPLANALSLGITVNPDRVRPGEGLMVAITVTNDTASTVNGVTLRMPMPATGVNVISPDFGGADASCPGNCDPGENVTWNIGTIGPGQGVRRTIPLVVSTGTADGAVINVAAAALIGSVVAQSVAQSVTVDPDNALSLAVGTDRDGVAPGGVMTYSVHYGNRSAVNVTGATLSLPLPPGATFVSATGGGALSGNTVLWSLNTLQGGQSGRQQVVVSIGNGLASGTLLPVNAAQIAGFSVSTGDELARTTFTSRVQNNAVLGLAIAIGNDVSRQNEGVRAAFTVSNPNNFPVFGAVLVVRMPSAGFATISPSFHSGGANCPGNCDPYEFVTWNLGTLPAGTAVTVNMANVVSADFASGRLVNVDAELTASGTPMVIGQRTLAVDADNALTLQLAVDKDGVAPGDALTYTLGYGNRGAASVTGAMLAMPLPAGTTFVSATGGGTLVGGAVQWAVGTLPAGTSARQQVVVNVSPTLPSGALLMVDAASLAGSSAITGTEVAQAPLASRIQTNPGLGLAIATSNDPARPNEAVRTAFTVSNRSGDSTAFGTVLRVRVPMEGFNTISPDFFVGTADCPGNCDPYEFVTWNIGTLAPGASRTVVMVQTVQAGFQSGRLLVIEAEAVADGLPSSIARRTLMADGDNALLLALHADKDSVAPGERITYSLDYANRSTGTVNNTVLTFPIPAGATLVASSGATMAGNRVSWNLAGLLAGTGGRRTVTLAVPASAVPGLQLRVDAATLTGTSAATGAEQARAGLHARVVASNPLRLSLLSLGNNPTLPNQALTATLRVSNLGAVPLNAVNVRARVPMEGVNTLVPSTLSPVGQCPGNCDPYEFVSWNIASLAAGASATFTMPMTVSSPFATGRQIWLQAVATDDNGDQSLASGTAMIGTQFSPPPACTVFGDFDGNGVVGFSDLAAFRANFGSTNAQYDLDGNGSVNFADLALFKTLFGNSAAASCAGALAQARTVADASKR